MSNNDNEELDRMAEKAFQVEAVKPAPKPKLSGSSGQNLVHFEEFLKKQKLKGVQNQRPQKTQLRKVLQCYLLQSNSLDKSHPGDKLHLRV